MSKKKKDKKKKEETPIKRKIGEFTNEQSVPKSNHKIYVYDPEKVLKGGSEKVLEGNSIIGFDINGKTFRIKFDKKNNCLSIDCMCSTLYIQPVTTSCFLIK